MHPTKVSHAAMFVVLSGFVLLTAAATMTVGAGAAAAGSGPPAGMERSGVDYVKMNVDWAAFFQQLKATGRDFIGRYLPVQGALHRCVTTTELAAASAAGVDCFFWFETLSDLYRARKGFAAGAADASEALIALAGLGVPTTTPVYYTVDFLNTDGSQIDAYFQGIASVVPVSQIGAYGDYTTIDWLSSRSMATYFCQSDFWMDARGWHPQAQMHQKTATFSIGGVYVDRLIVAADRFGQKCRCEQTDPRLLYAGDWSTGTLPSGSCSGGSYAYSASAGASVTVAFDGTGLGWIATKSPASGTAAVSVDDGEPVTVSLEALSTLYRQNVWGTASLADGLHTVKITRISGTVNVDAFDIAGTLWASTIREESSDTLSYSGEWASAYSAVASGGYYAMSDTPDASATIHFTGRRVDLLAPTGPTMGLADLYVDGEFAATVDLHGTAPVYGQKVWTSGELLEGNHVLAVVRGKGSPAGSYVGLDALEMVGMAGMPPTVAGVTPDLGSTLGGRTAVITGSGFVGLRGPGAVTFGGADVEEYTVESTTQIRVLTPAHPEGQVQVQVDAAGGATDDTPGDDYSYVPPVECTSIRGTDRYHTARLVSQAMFPGSLPAGAGLVLAPGETFQEALCGGPLAAAWGGPVLLTYQTVLDNGARSELQRLAPSQVFCIGMAPAVVDAVRDVLPDAVVTPISGEAGSPYDMSYRVAKELASKVGDMSGATAIMTIGTDFPDAIGVAPLACAKRWPILLTESSGGDAMNGYAVHAMAELGITTYLKVGTYAPDPSGVTGLANLSGRDRYDTCTRVVAWSKSHAGLGAAHMGLATGDKFPDGLAAGPYLAEDGGTLLLTPLFGDLSVYAAATIYAERAHIERFTFLAMIDPAVSQVKALLP